jgi:hypothetical protein
MRHNARMSTLAEIEAALPRLTAAELSEVERLAKAVRADKETGLPHARPARPSGTRPKVGETIDPPFHVPDSAFAPLTAEELKTWGL